jgi:hypothetical protein
MELAAYVAHGINVKETPHQFATECFHNYNSRYFKHH